MNRQQRRAAKRKVKGGDMIRVVDGKGPDGYYWFEAPEDYRMGDLPPHGTLVYGPFATMAESAESQRLVLLGPQSKVTDGGMWNPAWDRLQ
jgi:hypothetical protein